MISQLTVFLENEKGRLAAATRAVADAGVNMHALYRGFRCGPYAVRYAE